MGKAKEQIYNKSMRMDAATVSFLARNKHKFSTQLRLDLRTLKVLLSLSKYELDEKFTEDQIDFMLLQFDLIPFREVFYRGYLNDFKTFCDIIKTDIGPGKVKMQHRILNAVDDLSATGFYALLESLQYCQQQGSKLRGKARRDFWKPKKD